MMNTPRDYWPRWAEVLRRHQLNHFAASLLEAGSPLAVLGAQALYFSRGFFNSDSDQLTALASMLEEDQEARAFADFITREAAP